MELNMKISEDDICRLKRFARYYTSTCDAETHHECNKCILFIIGINIGKELCGPDVGVHEIRSEYSKLILKMHGIKYDE
jgi:hypothetical protein